jgi:5-amino-6-(5-phosphoribosylamino)uracil reductase
MQSATPGSDLQYQQLFPQQRTVTADDALGALDPAEHAGRELPYTLVNFVCTADGRAAFGGRSGPIGDDGDRQLFHGLRERVDAVIAGTSTLRTENYGRITTKPYRRERRAERGLTPEPFACIVTRSGDVPTEIPLFAEPEARVVVFTPSELDTSGCAAQVDVVRLDPGELTLTTAVRRLAADYGVRMLLCEGGPTLFGSLLHEELVDELFLTLVPKLAGGDSGPPITTGPPLSELLQLTLLWQLERDGSLFLRYGTR